MANNKAVPTRMCMGHKSPLLDCKGTNIETEFYDSWSPFTNGKMFYCKNCIDKLWKYYLEETNDNKIALWYCCQKLDVPFLKDIYEKLYDKEKYGDKSGRKSTMTIKSYIVELQKSKSKKDIWTDFSASDMNILSVSSKVKTREEKQKEMEKFILDWGYQDDTDDYSFLEYVYDELTDGKALSKPQEMLYRDLCIARLKKRKIDSGELKEEDSTKVQKQILDLMQKLKIDNFMEEKNKSDIDKILEKQIWEIENEEPAELVDREEYKDFLGIGNTWYNHILRAVRNICASSKEYPDVTKDEWN